MIVKILVVYLHKQLQNIRQKYCFWDIYSHNLWSKEKKNLSNHLLKNNMQHWVGEKKSLWLDLFHFSSTFFDRLSFHKYFFSIKAPVRNF